MPHKRGRKQSTQSSIDESASKKPKTDSDENLIADDSSSPSISTAGVQATAIVEESHPPTQSSSSSKLLETENSSNLQESNLQESNLSETESSSSNLQGISSRFSFTDRMLVFSQEIPKDRRKKDQGYTKNPLIEAKFDFEAPSSENSPQEEPLPSFSKSSSSSVPDHPPRRRRFKNDAIKNGVVLPEETIQQRFVESGAKLGLVVNGLEENPEGFSFLFFCWNSQIFFSAQC